MYYMQINKNSVHRVGDQPRFNEYISLNIHLTTMSAAQTTNLGMVCGGKQLW
jgi:hypothetical protein